MLEAHDQNGPSEQKTHKKRLCVLIDAHSSSGRYHHKLLCAHFVPVTSAQFKGGRGPLLPERLGLVLDIASRKSLAKKSACLQKTTPGVSYPKWKVSVSLSHLPHVGVFSSPMHASKTRKQINSDRIRAQELCESRGGRPGLPVPNSQT